MGKKKLDLIEPNLSTQRLHGFKRRYKTVFKKAIEVSSFTSTRILVILNNKDSSILHQYCNEPIKNFLATIEKYQGVYHHYKYIINEEKDDFLVYVKEGYKNKGLIESNSSDFEKDLLPRGIVERDIADAELLSESSSNNDDLTNSE